jgi:hypothetical protein
MLLESTSRRIISHSARAIIALPGKRVVFFIPSFAANSGNCEQELQQPTQRRNRQCNKRMISVIIHYV